MSHRRHVIVGTGYAGTHMGGADLPRSFQQLPAHFRVSVDRQRGASATINPATPPMTSSSHLSPRPARPVATLLRRKAPRLLPPDDNTTGEKDGERLILASEHENATVNPGFGMVKVTVLQGQGWPRLPWDLEAQDDLHMFGRILPRTASPLVSGWKGYKRSFLPCRRGTDILFSAALTSIFELKARELVGA